MILLRAFYATWWIICVNNLHRSKNDVNRVFVTLSFSTATKKTAQSGYGSTKVISSFSWGTQNWCSTRGGVGVVAAPGVSLRCWSTGTTELQTPNKEGAWGGVKCGPTQVINTMSLSLSLQLQSRGYMRPAAPPTFSAASAMLSCSMTPGVFSIRSLWRRLKKKKLPHCNEVAIYWWLHTDPCGNKRVVHKAA